MIKIDNPDLKNISLKYFDDIKDTCIERAVYISEILSFANGTIPLVDLTASTLHKSTKKSLLNLFLINKYTKNEILDFVKVTAANIQPWVFIDLILLNQICTYFADENNLKAIILCDPANCFSEDYRLLHKFGLALPGSSNVISVIGKILDYNIFEKHAYTTGNSLKINTCPYCNRVPVHTIFDSNKDGVLKPSYDHFYPHSKHPFLGMSFFNLVPSCNYCNSSFKNARGIQPETHLHPYIEGFGNDYYFKVEIDKRIGNDMDPNKYCLTLQPSSGITANKKRQIKGNNNNEGNINLFKLDLVYTAHKDVVAELVTKCNKYSSWYSGPLLKLFGSMLSTNKSEFYQFYFGNYLNEKDFNRRPLAKMTKDVVSQALPKYLKT